MKTTAARPTPTNQNLAPRKVDDTPVKFKSTTGADVELSVALTQKYFCPSATPAEAYVFNSWCAHNGLDPWKKEAYLVKYGNNPPQMLTSKDAFIRRAEANPRYQGQKAGVVVVTADGKIENRVGEIVLDDEKLVGGWAEVYVKDYVVPITSEISFKERCQYKDGQPMAKWATSPGLMIRKCALVAALREAFSREVGGMYVPDEMGFEEPANANIPIEPKATAVDAVYTDADVDPNTGEVNDRSIQDSFFDEEG